MYSAWARLNGIFGFFLTCLGVVLPTISLLNFLIRPSRDVSVNLSVNRVSSHLGVEDYFMNRKVMLTDLSLNLDAGKFFTDLEIIIFKMLNIIHSITRPSSLLKRAALFFRPPWNSQKHFHPFIQLRDSLYFFPFAESLAN